MRRENNKIVKEEEEGIKKLRRRRKTIKTVEEGIKKIEEGKKRGVKKIIITCLL